MKNEVVIEVKDLTIRFNLEKERVDNLKEYAIKFIKKELMFQEFLALKGVSFKIRRGEAWGFVGPNGSGKSTLLKAISGILQPYAGSVVVNGRIAPLIELGAGFDKDLTARENIYLNGLVLGYSRSFIEEHFDEIVDFANIEDFLDSPVKNFSSGMKARLGFAIATVTDPDILIVDEVLEVGDLRFRNKCNARMKKMLDEGTTLLYVSHNTDSVKRMCDHAIWLDHGEVVKIGDADVVCDAYVAKQEELIALRRETMRERRRKNAKKQKYDYLIVGAGLYGAVFARVMKRSGKRCLVIDRRDHIGGNVYSEDVAGIQVHKYGAHIFHTSNERVWKFINRQVPFTPFVNSPVARYGDEIYNLPFNMNTFSRLWGLTDPDEVKKKIEEQIAQLGITEPSNLEEQALSLVGPDVYEKLVKGYTEKQWGRDCRDLPAFIIRRLPLRFTYDNNYFNDKYQGIPEGGYGALMERLLRNIHVELGVDYRDYIRENPGRFDKVVYTGMIDEFYDYRFGHLEYRSLRFETERIEKENYQGNAVVNYTKREVPYTRIIEHKYFEPGKMRENPLPYTVISREYPETWKPGMEPYYPVNDEKNNALYRKYRKLADQEEKVIFGGRLAEYKYYDMDKVVAAALEAAEKELGI